MGWWEQRAGLDGIVAVVTGGAGGLGEGITRDLAANGVRVAVIDWDPDAVGALSTDLARQGSDAVFHVGDVRDGEALAGLFAAAEQRWGRLDTLVNVVGGTFAKPFAETSPRAWDALLRINLGYVLEATSLAIPAIRAGGRGGSIVNITTIEAHRAAPNFAVYSAAKAAVTQFARTLAVELAPQRIRVNCVAPDMSPTPNMLRLGAEAGSTLTDPLGVPIAIPLGRLGTVADVSHAVVFLASQLSAYITGTVLHPDGGTSASSGWFNWPGDGFGNTVPARLLDVLRAES